MARQGCQDTPGRIRRLLTGTHAPLIVRLRRKSVVQPNGCVEWTGSTNPRYGMIAVGGKKNKTTHVIAWEHYMGPVPEGLELDHLCRNTLCWNITHLEPVTKKVNQLRGTAGQVHRQRFAKITHCPSGHSYAEDGYVENKTNKRKCNGCRRDRARRKRNA